MFGAEIHCNWFIFSCLKSEKIGIWFHFAICHPFL